MCCFIKVSMLQFLHTEMGKQKHEKINFTAINESARTLSLYS